ncbi:hypothetical protein EST38_g12504 [Candolleomyces aberdarensis]|uniref:Uncharacterized protein n=1 Tax=Candolleomyces aberdarensis TaxID=2316362 RepID=A0A4Q2D295_9AGAR|nr:hypothetical protein EST38_g12504 [Candolleomyces aberdarensis]
MDANYDVSTPWKLAHHWTRVLIIPGLAGPRNATPSSHRSQAAQDLLDNKKFYVHTWDYPGPPDGFLDHTWDLEWSDVSKCFGNLSQKQPCDLKETPMLENIITPMLQGLNIIFSKAFKVQQVHSNMTVCRDEKSSTGTTPDISAFKCQWLEGNAPGQGYWDKIKPHLAFMEGKGPLSAQAGALNEGLDQFVGAPSIEELVFTDDYDEIISPSYDTDA